MMLGIDWEEQIQPEKAETTLHCYICRLPIHRDERMATIRFREGSHHRHYPRCPEPDSSEQEP